MDTLFVELDAPDVGGSLGFWAVRRLGNPQTWQYHYGLQFESTRLYGGEGRCGDGDDAIISEGTFEIPENVVASGDEENWIRDFANDNMPSIPSSVLDEYTFDSELCECEELFQGNPRGTFKSFAELYTAACERDDKARADEVEAWGRRNGWSWNFMVV